MLSSNGMQATIKFFLNMIKLQNPEILPLIFMTDCNHAQVNVICTMFPDCQCIFYCWWHMLQASWPKFATNHVINMWQNEPRVSAASKAHVPRMWLSHVHIVVLFLYNINYHELYKFLFYKISKLYLWYE